MKCLTGTGGAKRNFHGRVCSSMHFEMRKRFVKCLFTSWVVVRMRNMNCRKENKDRIEMEMDLRWELLIAENHGMMKI